MCVYSMVIDHYNDRWPRKLLPYESPWPPYPPLGPQETPEQQAERAKQQEEELRKVFEQLNKKFPKPEPISDEEIREFRDLLKRAREYDKRNNEPDCESESKKTKLLKALETMGLS